MSIRCALRVLSVSASAQSRREGGGYIVLTWQQQTDQYYHEQDRTETRDLGPETRAQQPGMRTR